VSPGTFAVISLMVGQVVNKGYHTHVGQKILLQNDNVSTPLGLLSNGTTAMPNPLIEPLVRSDGYANPVKLGFALSLTFVVGIIQVCSKQS